MKAETLVQTIDRRKEESLQIKKAFISNWSRNLFYYLDRLQVSYSEELSKFTSEEPIYIPYIPVNIAFAKFCNIEADVLSLPLSFTVNALTNKLEDKTAAKVAERFLNSIIAPKLRDIRESLLFWMLWTSRPLVKVYWSEKGGEPITIPEITSAPGEYDLPLYLKEKEKFKLNENGNKIPLTDKDNKRLYQKVKEGKPVFKYILQGDVAYSVLSPYEYYIDPMAKEKDALYNPDNKARWVIHQKLMSREEIEDKGYGTDEMAFGEHPVSEFEKEYLSLSGIAPAISDEYALYVESWELPSKNHKKGRFGKVIGGKIIEETDLPEPCLSLEQLPFVDVADSYNSFSWFNKSIIERIIPLQKAYSEESSLLLHLAKKCGRVRMAIQGKGRGSGVDIYPVKNDELIDEVVKYSSTGNQPPQFIMWDKIPMAILRHLDWILRDIQMIAGIHDIGAPIKKPQLATEILQTVEQDEKRMGKLIGILSDRFVRLGQWGLEFIKDRYHKGREYFVTNEFGQLEMKAFDRTTYLGNYRIQEDMGKPLYMSRAATWSFVERLIQMGVVTNKDEAIQLLSLQENLETIENQVDYQVAQRENLALLEISRKHKENPKLILEELRKDMPNVLEFHNHLIHIRVITKFLNQCYDDLTSLTVTIGIEHLKKHRDTLISTQVALQQQLQPPVQPKGTPQPTGGENAQNTQ